MDNLVLIRVADALRRAFTGVALEDVRSDAAHRLRLRFAEGDAGRSIVVSLHVPSPWVGRPAGPAPTRPPLSPFAGLLRKTLGGVPLAAVEKPAADRLLRLRFADGHDLVFLPRPGAPDLLLVGPDGELCTSWRGPRAARSSGHPSGAPAGPPRGPRWFAPPPPRGRLDPFGASPEAIDLALAGSHDDETPLWERMRRRLFGVGPAAAELVAAESAATGSPPGEVLHRRLAALIRGELDPVVEARAGAFEAAERGELDPDDCRVWPWEPCRPPRADRVRTRGVDAAATAGIGFEAIERAGLFAARATALETLVAREIARLRDAERRALGDLERFADPDQPRHWAEALLAGASRARRSGDAWIVVDPYDPALGEIAIPAPGGRSPTEAAGDLFVLHRRRKRGREHARQRAEEVAGQAGRLEGLVGEFAGRRESSVLDAFEHALRAAGVPVGLERAPRGAKGTPRVTSPRIEGVRLVTSSDGMTILVGKTGADNARLTFKLAGPEDFWFHAQGRAGAHVVVRNEARRPRPPEATLREAAELAAWFSAAREEGEVDVQWTRRKYVRRARGGSRGAVLLKRFETVRVRPRLPPSLAQERP